MSFPQQPRFRVPSGVLAAVVFVGSLVWFASGIAREPRFVDEAAFLSQTYFWDLFRAGEFSAPHWLEYPAYDLPPLPKYLMGAALQVQGIPRPGRSSMRSWYMDTSSAGFVDDRMLETARWPSVVLGAIGCVALFGIGRNVGGNRVGLLATVVLAINPLYALHARRAMADIPAEAFVLVTVWLALGWWKRALQTGEPIFRRVLRAIAIGLSAGLAVLAKLNGGLGLMAFLGLAGLGIILAIRTGKSPYPLIEGVAIASGVALITFVGLNPFETCKTTLPPNGNWIAPVDGNSSLAFRLEKTIRHRVEVSATGQKSFAPDALRTPGEKLSALVVQGFGRFGPFGPVHSYSPRRFDAAQDWGAWIWLPVVAMGLFVSIGQGFRQHQRGETPIGWAVALLWLISTLTVGLFLPLAWDRYFLPIQSTSALLAAIAAVSLFDAIRSRAIPT